MAGDIRVHRKDNQVFVQIGDEDTGKWHPMPDDWVTFTQMVKIIFQDYVHDEITPDLISHFNREIAEAIQYLEDHKSVSN